MLCPRCRTSTRVLESRRAPDGAAVRRRRECAGCGQRFTTFERREPGPLYVVKRDGERQRFDRTKLRSALLGAAHKRPLVASAIDGIVDRVELAALDRDGELTAEGIGELCLSELRRLDWGAYLQFAGTLPSTASEPAGSAAIPVAARSVRAAREDPGSTPEAASRRGLDE
jgi:transcriptional repressor NrdR